jgi:hypothetical protein
VLWLALAAASARAFWAPNHENINLQVVREGRPWGTDFSRGGKPVSSMEDYVARVLYVSMTPPTKKKALLDFVWVSKAAWAA